MLPAAGLGWAVAKMERARSFRNERLIVHHSRLPFSLEQLA